MKKHKQSLDHWFETKNRKQIAFTSSVILIGILFVVAIVSILVKEGPSADSVTDPIGRLAKRVTVGNGQLSYLFNGTNKTKPTNNLDVRIKAIPTITESRQGVYKANEISGLTPAKITVKTDGGAAILASPLAATAISGISGTQIKTAFDSDEYRNNVNKTNAKLKIKYEVPGYLSRTVTVTDPKSVLIGSALVAGNFVNTGDSADVIDEADSAKCGPYFKFPITADNKICDMNYDGAIDEADSAIWGPNFRQRATNE